jgi:hypothetical protein
MTFAHGQQARLIEGFGLLSWRDSEAAGHLACREKLLSVIRRQFKPPRGIGTHLSRKNLPVVQDDDVRESESGHNRRNSHSKNQHS